MAFTFQKRWRLKHTNILFVLSLLLAWPIHAEAGLTSSCLKIFSKLQKQPTRQTSGAIVAQIRGYSEEEIKEHKAAVAWAKSLGLTHLPATQEAIDNKLPFAKALLRASWSPGFTSSEVEDYSYHFQPMNEMVEGLRVPKPAQLNSEVVLSLVQVGMLFPYDTVLKNYPDAFSEAATRGALTEKDQNRIDIQELLLTEHYRPRMSVLESLLNKPDFRKYTSRVVRLYARELKGRESLGRVLERAIHHGKAETVKSILDVEPAIASAPFARACEAASRPYLPTLRYLIEKFAAEDPSITIQALQAAIRNYETTNIRYLILQPGVQQAGFTLEGSLQEALDRYLAYQKGQILAPVKSALNRLKVRWESRFFRPSYRDRAIEAYLKEIKREEAKTKEQAE